jgi:hypothetical protein
MACLAAFFALVRDPARLDWLEGLDTAEIEAQRRHCRLLA